MRIFLFLLTNAAVLLLISIIFNVLGLGSFLHRQGIPLDLNSLLLVSAAMGMTGSFISLLLSKWMAKQSMGVFVIEQPSNSTERWLVETVARLARRAGIGMPEVGLFDSPEPNAFATGMSKNNALVAVSTGLLQTMEADEVEAVLGHEISHVANGDMVTMGLLQGVVNTFVYFSPPLPATWWTGPCSAPEMERKIAAAMVLLITSRRWWRKSCSPYSPPWS